MRLAFFAVHFGLDYLEWAVRSVKDGVDQIHILYADKPSYGYSVPGAVCPDSEEELRAAAARGAGSTRLEWHHIKDTRTEGEHKNNAYRISQALGAEAFTLMDADEVWDPASLVQSFDYVCKSRSNTRWQCHFHHFWRSWKYTISDHFMPIRIVDMKAPHRTPDGVLTLEQQGCPVYHFGYAQREAIMRYKFTCHSHRPELVENKIDDWLDKKFYGWKLGDEDCHPSMRIWKPEETGPGTMSKLREIMPDHPHRDLELV